MRIFVTGASGWVGSAVAAELRGAGNRVLGLARSDAAAKALTDAGIEVHRGELGDLESLTAGAKACDGVAHLGFIHDFSKFAENVETDRLAVDALIVALEGSNKPLVITSGSLALAWAFPGRVASEDLAPPAMVPRMAAEMAVVASAERGVRASVIRLPPSVHGAGDHGFMAQLIEIAKAKGVSAYVGDGQNRWPAVCRSDAARLYRLALENGAGGRRYHAIGDSGVPVREIAEAIGRRFNLPAVSIPPDKMGEHFGFLAMFIGTDAPASSALTHEALGWTATGPGLIADLDAGAYDDAHSRYDATGVKR